MRLLIDLDAQLLERICQRAAAEGLTADEWLARTARHALPVSHQRSHPFRLVTAGGGGLRPGFEWIQLDDLRRTP